MLWRTLIDSVSHALDFVRWDLSSTSALHLSIDPLTEEVPRCLTVQRATYSKAQAARQASVASGTAAGVAGAIDEHERVHLQADPGSALRLLTGRRGDVGSYAVFQHVGTAFAEGTLLVTVRRTEPRL